MPRKLGKAATPTVAQRQKAPTRSEGWKVLLRKAIHQATVSKDPRLTRLKDAQIKNQAEKCLRQLGIISESDIKREFPLEGK